MRLRRIIEDYENATGLKATYREASEDENIVSRVQPAAVMSDGRIIVLKGMETEKLEESIAHEVMHKIVNMTVVNCRANENKVISEGNFDSNKKEDFIHFDLIMSRLDALALSINDALSHKKVVETLESKYGIDSHEHLHLLSECLDDSELIAACDTAAPEDYHAHGLVLLDLEQTMTELANKIDVASKLHPEIERAFLAGKEYLLPIINGIEIDMTNQRLKIFQFLRVLGYDEDILLVSETIDAADSKEIL
jgi:hypothetical protein